MHGSTIWISWKRWNLTSKHWNMLSDLFNQPLINTGNTFWMGIIDKKRNNSFTPNQYAIDFLESLVENLSDIQTALPVEYRNEIIHCNQLLNAVKYVSVCSLAYHKPADTVQGGISDLHGSLATMDQLQGFPPSPSEPAARTLLTTK